MLIIISILGGITLLLFIITIFLMRKIKDFKNRYNILKDKFDDSLDCLVGILDTSKEVFKNLQNSEGENIINDLIDKIKKVDLDKGELNNSCINFNNLLNEIIAERIKKSSQRDNSNEQSLYNSFHFYKLSINNLFDSIVSNISKTTTPISAELFQINEIIENFKKEVQHYEDEIKNKKTMDSIIKSETNLVEEQKVLSNYINSIFDLFQTNMDSLNGVINQIYEKTKNIEDISEKISILSINSSIEAARAGSYGAGFKVISGEIRKLSDYSKKFVNEINYTITNSRILFSKLKDDFLTNEKSIIDKINSQTDGFVSSFERLTNFLGNFSDVYKGMNEFMEGLKFSVLKVNPVIQLHAITIQEMENLAFVIGDFIDNNMKLFGDDIFPFDEISIKKFTEIVRKRLTTSRELDALDASVKKLGVVDGVDLKRSEAAIEFF